MAYHLLYLLAILLWEIICPFYKWYTSREVELLERSQRELTKDQPEDSWSAWLVVEHEIHWIQFETEHLFRKYEIYERECILRNISAIHGNEDVSYSLVSVRFDI